MYKKTKILCNAKSCLFHHGTIPKLLQYITRASKIGHCILCLSAVSSTSKMDIPIKFYDCTYKCQRNWCKCKLVKESLRHEKSPWPTSVVLSITQYDEYTHHQLSWMYLQQWKRNGVKCKSFETYGNNDDNTARKVIPISHLCLAFIYMYAIESLIQM